MSEAKALHHSGGRATRVTANGDRITTRRRNDETPEAFAARVEWGRFDELVIDFCHDGREKTDAGTLRQYRSDFNVLLLPLFGDLWLTECTDSAYDKLLAIADTRSHNAYERAHRTLGALITWAVRKKRWPTHVPAFGGSEYRRVVHRDKVRSAPVDAQSGRGQIKIEDCPTWAETVEFADALGDAAAEEWGPHARALGRVPIVQYATGARIATAFAFHADQLRLRTGHVHLRWQIDRNTSWAPVQSVTPREGWQPPLKLIKQRRPDGHDAGLWDSVRHELVDLAEAATARRGGWFFATLIPDCKRPLDRFEVLEREVRKQVGYRWTSHYHRHAYASWNLTPRSDGGYGRSLRTVAEWLGDGVNITARTYWHPSVEVVDGWADHLPGATA